MRSQRLRWVQPDRVASLARNREPAVELEAADSSLPMASALMSALEAGIPLHDPPLPPRDEAAFLLHTAAEIEHALMVQYLYAAWSLKRPDEIPADDPRRAERQEAVARWRAILLGIAKEEMGHLMTVQNLLLLLGGSVNFEREDFPFRSALYPFRFRLEPLTKESLAKYVLAEKGEEHTVPEELVTRASSSTAGAPVNRVGALYARLYCIFTAPGAGDEGSWFPCSRLVDPAVPELHLADRDFMTGVASFQGSEEWRLQDPSGFPTVLVPPVTSREQALAAIREVAEQGEGGTNDPRPSHFTRLFEIYQQFPETDPNRGASEWVATRTAPVDPNTLREPDAEVEAGTIRHPRSRGWAELFDLRYRMLLTDLSHVLQLDRGAAGGAERSAFLVGQSFSAMFRMTALADLLLGLPLRADGGPERAGPPFELPYTLALPHREEDRGGSISTCGGFRWSASRSCKPAPRTPKGSCSTPWRWRTAPRRTRSGPFSGSPRSPRGRSRRCASCRPWRSHGSDPPPIPWTTTSCGSGPATPPAFASWCRRRPWWWTGGPARSSPAPCPPG